MNIKLTNLIISLLMLALTSFTAFTQSTIINSYLRYISEGKVEFVKSKIPDLISQYGDEEPGVLLLQGVVKENAEYATPFYKKIIEKYPNSEWTPHALWRLIQYYSMVTDTTTAKRMLDKFREKYPTSPFLSAATESVRLAISDAKYQNREKYKNPKLEKEDKQEVNEVPAVANKQKYGLQVAIYSTKAAADAERERFIKTARLRTEVLEKLVLGERKYAVIIGNYDSEEEAEKAKSIVERQCECNPLIFKK